MFSSEDETDHRSKEEKAHGSGEDDHTGNDRQSNYDLINHPSSKQKQEDFSEIIKQVESTTNHKNVSFKHDLPDDLKDIIQSNSSQYILNDMEDSINYNIPILLVSSDDIFKALTPESFCKILGLELIRLDMSPEITVQDLIGRYSENEESWLGISIGDGPLLEAFDKGKVLLLNEIDKAQISVYHFLEKILNDNVININLNGRSYEEIKMHKKFHLIISRSEDSHSLNPDQEQFEKRFKKIQFPSFTKDDLLKLSLKRGESYGYNDQEVVGEIVNFHESLKSTFPKEQYQFTFREIDATLFALSKEEDIYNTIMTIYGARFPQKDEFLKKLSDFSKLNKTSKEAEPQKYPNCHNTSSLDSASMSLNLSLKNRQNVLLVGDDGCGKTQLALWASENYNKNLNIKDKGLLFMCTKDSKVADLVGGNSSSDQITKNSDLNAWQAGFLPKHIKQGSCCILDNIDQAPNFLLSRIISLLGHKSENFKIPESTSCQEVKVHENFRIIATCNINNLNLIHPNIRNEFNIIVLNNQLDNISETDLKQMIEVMLDRYRSSWFEYHSKHHEEDDLKDTSDSDFHIEDEDGDVEEKTDAKFKYSEDLIQLIYEKLISKDIKDISIISRICRSVIYLHFFLRAKEVNEQKTVDLVFNLLEADKDLTIPDEIANKLCKKLDPTLFEIGSIYSFFYREIPQLRQFFAKLLAYSLIEQPICIIGSEGVGKRSALRTFSLIRPNKSSKKITYQSCSFDKETKSTDFFGSSTFCQDSVQFNDGPLTTALKRGLVCILNNINLTDEKVIDSLSIVLDSTIERNVFIPNNNNIVTISPDFFFACCITDKSDLNSIPNRIKRRLVQINYPVIDLKNNEEICKEIIKFNLGSDELSENEQNMAKSVSEYMSILNQINLKDIYHWSFNDINKLFKRYNNDKMKLKHHNENKLYYHILFYTLSSVLPEDIGTVKGHIAENSFKSKLDEEQLKSLFECYDAVPTINNNKIVKKEARVSFNNIDFIDDTYEKLPSMKNLLYQFSLLDKSESVLFVSKSEFNTFIGDQFLSTVEKLVHQEDSCFLTLNEAKLLYNECIGKILNIMINNDENNQDYNRFYFVIDQLSKILLHTNISIIKNFVFQFNPKNFIAYLYKLLFNVPTPIFDKFKELLSQKIDVSSFDDIEFDIEMEDCTEIFRIFASTSSDCLSNLPDEIKSVFTFIYVSEYSQEEQQEILTKTVNDEFNFFKEENVPRLNDFANEYRNEFKKSISFSQKLKIIEITNSLIEEDSSEDKIDEKLSIILYRYLGGVMTKENRESLINLLNSKFKLPENYLKDVDNVFEFDEEKGYLTSKMSGITNKFAQETDITVAFTRTFNDLLDLIHLSLTIHAPVILNGPIGQGKHTAIRYLADILNMDVVPITILSSTKVEDLFGRDLSTQNDDGIRADLIETEFVQLIKNDGAYGYKNTLIVIEMMNNASYDVLNALIPVFNKKVTDILLPNGDHITKGQFDIIGICYTQQGCTINPFPQQLINSSINYTVIDPDPDEIVKIIKTKIDLTEGEALNFSEDYKAASNIISEPLTLDDIEKYFEFRNETDQCLRDALVSQLVLAGRCLDLKEKDKYLSSLLHDQVSFNPNFSYDSPITKLFVRVDNDSKSITLESNPKDINAIKKVNSLTTNQKHALMFLICSYLSKRTCVLQGPRGSGKTHIVRLFAELLGKELTVFQMSPETNLSLLIEESKLDVNLSDRSIKDLEKESNKLRDLLNAEENVKKLIKEDLFNFSKTSIHKLLSFIKDNENILTKLRKWDKINSSVQSIIRIINPLNNINHPKSKFIEAMQEGGLVLLDGIESAPSEVAEIITSLCTSKSEINLYQYGPEYHFTPNKDFHLFITYNYEMSQSNKIDKSFLIKGATFSLYPIEGQEKDSSQILFGEFRNDFYSKDFSANLASHLASLHNSMITKDGDFIISPYILNYEKPIFQEFEDLNDSIDLIFHLFYCNDFENEEKLYSKCIKEFIKEPEIKIDEFEESFKSDEDKNDKYLLHIRRIQNNIQEDRKPEEFSFQDFFDDFYGIEMSHILFVQPYIKYTVDMMMKNIKNISKDQIRSDSNPMVKYGIACTIYSLYESLIQKEAFNNKKILDLTLDDSDLRNNPEKKADKIKSQLLRFDLLNELIQEQFYSRNSSFVLGNKLYLKIISLVATILSNEEKKSIVDLFDFIHDNYEIHDHDCIDFVDLIFPYSHFNKSSYSLIKYWIPLTREMIKNDIHFTLIIDDNEFDFNPSSKFDIGVYLIMNEANNLLLSPGSKFTYEKGNKNKEFIKDDSKFCYYQILELVNQKQIVLADTRSSSTIIKQCYENGMWHYNREADQSLNDDKILSVKNIFVEENPKPEIISLIWNIVFTFDEKSIQDLSQIINPVESKLLLTAFKMFNLINNQYINEIVSWTIWTEALDEFIDPISKLYFDTVESEYNNDRKFLELLKDASQGLSILERRPTSDSNFWEPRDLIQKCQKGFTHLKFLKEEKDRIAKENEIKERLNYIKKNLNSNSGIKPKYLKMRTDIIKLISETGDFNDDNFNHIHSAVNAFQQEAVNYYDYPFYNPIVWPVEKQLNTPNTNDKKMKDENIKLFELLINYSRNMEPIRQLDTDKNIISNIRKLSEFEFTKNPAKILLSDFILNYKERDHFGLIPNDKKNAEYTLEALTINELFNINSSFITDPDFISKRINAYSERNLCSNTEINWIYMKIRDVVPNLSILIPKFSYNSLVFLVVNKAVDKDYAAGPLFTKYINSEFYKKLSELMFRTDYKSFTDAAKYITKSIFSFFNEEDLPDISYKEIKDAFLNIKEKEEKFYEISTQMEKVFTIAESLDKWTQPKLNFDDLFFLSQDFDVIANESKYIKQYPLLVHWLSLNSFCAGSLKYFYQNYIPKSNEIPFWVVCLRILSSQNCLKFNVTTNNNNPFDPSKLPPPPQVVRGTATPYPYIVPGPPKPQPEPEPEKEIKIESPFKEYLDDIVKKIKRLNRTDVLELSDDIKKIDIDEKYLNTNNPCFKFDNLIRYTQYFISCLFNKISKSNIPFPTMCSNLLIDCSKHIEPDKKLYNFILLIGFSYTLLYAEIPFTISVFAEQSFNFVLKKFDELMSDQVLQRVFDCLFINREKCTITDTFNFALNELSYSGKSQRAIFILSDGLSENLILTNGWKKKLLNNKNISLGLIFIDHYAYNMNEYKPIKKMWDRFNDSVQTAESLTRLIYVKQDYNEATINSIVDLFEKVLSRPVNRSKSIPQFDLRPSFVNKYYYNYNKLSKNAYDKIVYSFRAPIETGGEETPTFKKMNNQFFTMKSSVFQPVDVDFYQSNLNKIASSAIDSKINEADFINFIKSNVLVQQSTKTKDALLSILKQNSKRESNLNVSIIIDTSMSCFNSKVSSHSYQTIKALFSTLHLIKSPTQPIFVNIIITTNDAPIILCSQKSNEDLFKEDSSIWPSLFSVLSNNCPFPNILEPAIHAAFDICNIKNTRRNDAINTLFVLTDGLYSAENKEIIKKHVAACEQNRIAVYGIGIGLYPYGISEMFTRAVFAPNPVKLIESIIDINKFSNDEMEQIKIFNEFTNDHIDGEFKKLKQYQNNPVFKPLRDFIQRTPH